MNTTLSDIGNSGAIEQNLPHYVICASGRVGNARGRDQVLERKIEDLKVWNRHQAEKLSIISDSKIPMSSSKVFVGGLSYSTDDQSLREVFISFVELVEARVIMDRETGRSRGFGFVTFTSSEEASIVISGMDGMDVHSRMVRVNYTTDRTGGFRDGGDYGGRGGASGGCYGGYGGVALT
ncbi:glycine-rich RNA-binding protein 3, mitochondrial-like [Zingiber officinale]|uniref:glycine-rich RNA-binding protein 3, mitochondrial-like n=1 Tax=Zingiber officinale TaxID=94328 RepID=UPI001C4A7DE5|nr:glycine-rich RNA-binding protein 3, mitochondrial-like [Zingiber officinale]